MCYDVGVEQKEIDFQKGCSLIDEQRIEDLRLAFGYLSILSLCPIEISPELKEKIDEIIRRERSLIKQSRER
jgi:hypothetical protein